MDASCCGDCVKSVECILHKSSQRRKHSWEFPTARKEKDFPDRKRQQTPLASQI
jgi:hypothetical protein